ncbi:MAG: hypothetical protein K0Q77_2813 [Anaerosporomusa subterranea]|nr:hypothetical protein [Anaerosporomusa subterranea]
MDKIIEQVEQWGFLKKLPEELHGFRLERNIVQEEAKLFLFWYRCPETRRDAYALYDMATKEFMFHSVIGLFDFCDIQYISPDLAAFEEILKERLSGTLQALAVFNKSELGSIFITKNILEKNFMLPEDISGFELFIRPEQPVKIVNGSFIIIDYSDFSSESNLTIYYNIYRDEFFCERRIRRLPQIVTDFDSKTVDELAEKLTVRLQPVLFDLRRLLADNV